MLANSEYQEQIYATAPLLDEIIAFDRKFYPKPGVVYDEMNLRTLRLSPPQSRIADLEQDYLQMLEMIFGEKPTWDELLTSLATIQNQLHTL